MCGAGCGAVALVVGAHEAVHSLSAVSKIAGAGVGTSALKANALETVPRDGTPVSPLACVLEAGAHEVALGSPAVLTAGTQKACAGNGAGGGACALIAAPVACTLDASDATVHEAVLGLPAVPTAGVQKMCAGDGAGGDGSASALKPNVHEIALDAQMSGAT